MRVTVKTKKVLAASLAAAFAISMIFPSALTAQATGNGNPQPGFPHDTLVIHIQKKGTGSVDCTGGHSAHIGAELESGRVVGPLPAVQMEIMMVDWVDEDGDPSDGINDDPYSTKFIDCDTRMDPVGEEKLILQIGDKDPRKDWITIQSWFIRMVGIPNQEFGMVSTNGSFTTCVVSGPGLDGVLGTPDDEFTCTPNEVDLNDIDLSGTNCVKKVAKNGGNANGKTVFCDITNSFLVDIDTDMDGDFECRGTGDGRGDADLCGVHIFTIGCEDPFPETPEHELADQCPLGSALWTFDESTQRPTIQIFVSHDGNSKVTSGKGNVQPHQ